MEELLLYRVHCGCGRGRYELQVQVHRPRDDSASLVGDDPAYDPHQDGDERKEEQRIRHVEDGVRVGYLPSDVRRGGGHHVLVERQKREEDRGADDVEEHVRRRGLLGGSVGAERGEHRGDRGAYVVAEENGEGGFKRQKPLRSHGHREAYRRGTRLHYHCDRRTDEKTEHRRGAESNKKVLSVAQEGHGALHRLHTKEEQTEADETVADVLLPFRPSEKHQQNPDTKYGEREILYLESNYLRDDRGADVRTHDNADGLFQGHQPRVDEAHRHNGRAAAALDKHGDERADKNASDGSSGQGTDKLAHLVAGEVLERLAHQFYTEKKKSNAPENLKRTAPRHENIPRSFVFTPEKHSIPGPPQRTVRRQQKDLIDGLSPKHILELLCRYDLVLRVGNSVSVAF